MDEPHTTRRGPSTSARRTLPSPPAPNAALLGAADNRWFAAVIVGLMTIGMGSVGAMTAYWSLDRNLKVKIEQRAKNTQTIPANRGRILDRHGQALALSAVYYKAVFSPLAFKTYNNEQAQRIQTAIAAGQDTRALAGPISDALFAQEAAAFIAQYRDEAFIAPTMDEILTKMHQRLLPQTPKEVENQDRDTTLFTYLTPEAAQGLAARAESGAVGLPGLRLEKISLRTYPDRQLARQVIGLVDRSQKGIEGIESQYDEMLTGIDGKRPRQESTVLVSAPGTVEGEIPPIDGKDVHLTISAPIQFQTERILQTALETYGARAASALVMHIPDGELYAVANAPSVGPQDRGDDTRPYRINRAMTDAVEHGSVQKLITLAAFIENGIGGRYATFSVEDEITIGKEHWRDVYPHKTEQWTVQEIIARSSNVGAIKMGQAVNRTRLYEACKAFGLGAQSAVQFEGEAKGVLPAPNQWDSATLPAISIGYGASTTLIQMAQAYGIIANQGREVRPSLVQAATTASELPSHQPVIQQVVSPETAQTVTEILTAVVDTKSGTGKLAAVPGFDVAAKTGTAKIVKQDGRGYEEDQHNATVVGFAPAHNPQFVVAVRLTDPQPYEASKSAAPVFSQIMAQALRLSGVQPTRAIAPPSSSVSPSPGSTESVQDPEEDPSETVE